ncbi:T9SS type A sorting domain-containing protein [Flavobacterium zepuense]|uniref:T9SS type A sorting domain-containing protein n=1 Tax=Flavobacterium zepuense TaxID=2593302 RepID=A0A552UX90_9FLAO|nr:M12 family metallo-peptidase [Flavobacterium zepuense]TRW22770.1 T9SS type A sorting domain-containing protein [Flavobacterium zepuense]
MKNFTLLVALLSIISSFGQQKVAARVEALVKAKTVFRKFTPFTVANNPDAATLTKVVDKATFATLNASVTKDIATNKYTNIELEVPYNNSAVTVQLYRLEVQAKGFHVDTDKQKNIAYTGGAYYRGIIKGNSSSLVSFSFFDNEVNGIISGGTLNNLVIGKLQKQGNVSDYIIYSDAQLNILNDFTCGVTDTKQLPDVNGNAHKNGAGTLSDHCVTIYFEMDYDLFLQNNADTTTASNWITSVFNNVQTLYANDGITTAIKSVYIWTEQDPYFGSSSADYLEQFFYARPVFDGDLGQLISIDEGGLGGVAIDIGGLCSDTNVSYSDVNFEYQTVPVFSWTVEVITHELGHLMGSPHTHGCYWNGNGTAIDGCGTQAGYVEGGCDIGPIPSPEVQGTIMSYCHLVSGIGINFANGFGPQPAARILNHVESSLCLSTDCINTCINTVTGFNITNTTTTSATLTWDDETSGPWQIGYALPDNAITNWQEVNTNSFTINNLLPNTYYTFGIRPFCDVGMEPQIQNLIFATGADWCSGAQFTDTGADYNYSTNEHLIRVIKPVNPQQDIIVTFNSFETEEDYDFLYVYDGTGVDAPLIGAYSGDIIPGPFTSTAADGALTFEFTSDTNLTGAGWGATVSCTLGLNENTFTNLEYYPNPAHSSVTITSPEGITGITVYNIAGQLLLDKAVNATTAEADIVAFANGIYIFKVINGTKESHFRIVKH